MKYYKITDKNVLDEINAIFADRHLYIQTIEDFANRNGGLKYTLYDNFFANLKLLNLYVLPSVYESGALDDKLWKRATRGKYKSIVIIEPRQSGNNQAKQLHNEWAALIERDEFSYKPLLNLIIDGELDVLTKTSPNVCYVPNGPVLIQCVDYKVKDICEEITREDTLALLPNNNSDLYAQVITLK